MTVDIIAASSRRDSEATRGQLSHSFRSMDTPQETDDVVCLGVVELNLVSRCGLLTIAHKPLDNLWQ